ncbi:MAG: RNA polymerase sigma factor [Planctomycetota bacterium]|jgi:RNA polymerase sigma-70 factor (ECF subfamily)
MEDKVLVLLCKSGNREGLRRVYDKYRDDLLILAIALLNDVNAAEDVVHDVFVSFVGSLEGFKLSGSLRNYLRTCLVNRVRNVWRAERRDQVKLEKSDGLRPATVDPPESIICNEELQQVSKALGKLAGEQREVIVLRLREGMRMSLIAKLQGVSVNTARSRYRNGLSKLRSIMGVEV